MKLKKLLKDLPIKQIKGSQELEITGVCANSKLISPGNLFIARKGLAEDGTFYIPEAVSAGAIAILTDIYDPLLNKSVTQIIHPDVTALEAFIAAKYYGFSSKELFMVGITGTNGKTTTSFLVKHLLDNLGSSCGLIGTIEYIVGEHRYQATRTTPDASSTQKMLREMVLQNCKSAVMEVTSHALDQNRVDRVDFDVAVFTNLTLDHLDYHRTMENYQQAKSKLFKNLTPSKKSHSFPKTAIINKDSPWWQKMLEGCSAEILTYGIDQPADLMAKNIELSTKGTTCTVDYKGNQMPFFWPLIGRFNVYNCLAAIAVALSRQIPLQQIAQVLAYAPSIPGRLEAVHNPLDLKICVDYAHSDDALLNVLKCLQELKKGGRIITVFGCGGNRDTSKRPKMARVCELHSDIVIVTSDNPRNEDPAEIIRQVVSGFSSPDRYLVEMDRMAAIEKAIDLAQSEDIILIAGKGHETQQIFSNQIISFDDRQIAKQLCQKKFTNTSLGCSR